MNMFNEETKIQARFGKHDPFTVPEGYFEGITRQVMERLPDKEERRERRVSLWREYRVPLLAAACALFAVFGVGVYRQFHSTDKTPAMSLSAYYGYDGESSTFDEVADYAMIDTDVIYASLTDYEY